MKFPTSILYIFILLLSVQSVVGQQQHQNISTETKPLEVSVNLRINKIYNINSVQETYQIDGYFMYTWKNERAISYLKDSLANSIIFENDKAREIINGKLWIPAFELINVQGSRERPNIRIEIYSDGTVEYEERFFATCSTNMDFTKFPFDTQVYKIEVEAFSYGSKKITFKNPKLFLEHDHSDYLGEDWEFVNSDARVITKKYEFMDENVNSEKNLYSRVIFEVKAKRLSGYYEWQVLFPLLIIILASFSIFWIKEFGSQIGVGFTLMLTVVAFNFYSASILPKLPYNTFIEYVIIVGYIFIFLGILAVIINHRINGEEDKKDRIRLLRHFRYGFPLVYTIIMIVLYISLIF
ncbi:hypothetical protein H2O64_11215 [Kordia sp. YSTF-M3]|uniref:Neurotransmitter-gated ion-channel ligand-binding domain-containing protein n=1 Tax=Kordia aestuariivivens TaxID=2759037 RepID=A0ABR7Q9K5_9FLAO|nr:hypothetical protein [Kordia aestuariivivens]MBC8755246.1 hypothetical protein [Kordia aestuariivivens]